MKRMGTFIDYKAVVRLHIWHAEGSIFIGAKEGCGITGGGIADGGVLSKDMLKFF